MARSRHRRKNPLDLPITQGQKYILYGIGGIVVLLTTAAVVSASSKKTPPRRLVQADASCSMPSITDNPAWLERIRVGVRQAAALGTFDPFETTSALIRSQATTCTVYPADTRNPGEAKFYAQTFMAVVNAANSQNLISGQQGTTWNSMMWTWAAAQGVDLETL